MSDDEDDFEDYGFDYDYLDEIDDRYPSDENGNVWDSDCYSID